MPPVKPTPDPAGAVPRLASLPMYDLPRQAVQAWWQGIAGALQAEGLAGVPDTPDWPADLPAHWLHPRLLLSQACGHPLVTTLQGQVQVVGAMRYAAPGCEGTRYCSLLVVRDGEALPAEGLQALAGWSGRVAAVNDAGSFSGGVALRRAVQSVAGLSPPAFFGRLLFTGSHRASLAAVREGRADIAAIDAVTHALVARHQPALLHGLQVLARTASAPGLPLITALGTSPQELAVLRRALQAACAAPHLAAARQALLVDGFEPLGAEAWPAQALL